MCSILIAPNSFKECISSVDLAKLIDKNLKAVSLKNNNILINTILAPISDGGDGFLSVCDNYFELIKYSFEVTAPNKSLLINVSVGIDLVKKTCFIESADVVGLKISPISVNNPYTFNSYGLGELLFKLNEFNIKNNYLFDKVIIGIGGTCICDLGLGACEYFGLKIYNHNNKEIALYPVDYANITKVKWEKPKLSFNIELVADVNNVLLGKDGAINCFGVQKGIKKEDIISFEAGFENILSVFGLEEKQKQLLSGAGGGLAAGLMLFFDAKVKTAEDFILNDLGIKNLRADYLITGEGCFDYQSSLNKGAYILIGFFNSIISDIFVISGKKEGAADISKVNIIYLEDYFDNIEESIKNIKIGIEFASKKIIDEILIKEKNG